jgi:hypothetical protein
MSCKFFEVRYIKLRVFELQKEFKKSYENSERVKWVRSPLIIIILKK